MKHRDSGLLHNDVIFSPVESYIFKIYIILSGYSGMKDSECLDGKKHNIGKTQCV